MTENEQNHVKKSIVQILDSNESVTGTGFYISSSGYCITCYHVIEPLNEIKIKDWKGIINTALLDSEKSVQAFDIAVLKTDAQNINFLPISLKIPETGLDLWTLGFQHTGKSILGSFPAMGKYIGITDVQFTTKINYIIKNALKINFDTIEEGLSGAPITLLSSLNTIGICNAKFKPGGGFASCFAFLAETKTSFSTFIKQIAYNSILEEQKQLYSNLKKLTTQQVYSVISYMENNKKFMPTYYSPRKKAEYQITEFLTGTGNILPLIGNAGVGKSSTLYKTANDLAEKKITLLIPGYELLISEDGLRGEVECLLLEQYRETINSIHQPFVFDIKETIKTFECVEPVVIVDGFNELISFDINRLKRWIQKTSTWIKQNKIKLIISSRPDTWNLYEIFFPQELLATDDKEKELKIILNDFDDEEFRIALNNYQLPIQFRAKDKLQHPLLLRILWNIKPKENYDYDPTLSYYSVFKQYIDEKVRLISAELNVSPRQILYCLHKIAMEFFRKGQYSLPFDEYHNFLKDVPNLENKLISENLFTETKENVRIIFDQLAEFLIAKFYEEGDLELDWHQPDDTKNSLQRCIYPWLMAKKESEGINISTELLKISKAISNSRKPFSALHLINDIFSCLEKPATHFSTIEQLYKDIVIVDRSQEYNYLIEQLLRNTFFYISQKMRLIKIGLLTEDYYTWEMKHWEDMDSARFIHYAGGYKGVLSLLEEQLKLSPAETLREIASWLGDKTPLSSGNRPTEIASIGDIGCAILYHYRLFAFEDVTKHLALAYVSDKTHGSANTLLKIAEKNPLQLTTELIKWQKSPELYRAIAGCAQEIIAKNYDQQNEEYQKLIIVLYGILATEKKN